MNNRKNDEYYVAQMLKDVRFIMEHTANLTEENISEDEVLLDSISSDWYRYPKALQS